MHMTFLQHLNWQLIHVKDWFPSSATQYGKLDGTGQALLELHELAPTVGRRLLFPDDRCCAVSYARLLLYDSMLKAQQHRHGIDSSRECKCGHGIDDVQHFFLECERYRHIRKEMIDDITTIWQGSDNEGSLSLFLFSWHRSITKS